MNILEMNTPYRNTVNAYVRYLWGGPNIVTLGGLYDTSKLPGVIAEGEGALLGALLYRINHEEYEVSVLFSLVQGIGVGTRLLDSVVEMAKKQGIRRIWLVTTNDNTRAIRFYQKYGFSLKAIHIGGFQVTRKLKGDLPVRGDDNIPIEHELEFELIP